MTAPARTKWPTVRIDSNWRRTLASAVLRAKSGAPPWAWFPEPVQSVAAAYGMLPSQPIPEHESPAALASALRASSGVRPRIIYTHIPFCPSRCAYCGFYRHPSENEHKLEEYADCLVQQIRLLADTPWAAEAPLDGIFFGGGTPTVIPPSALERVIRAIHTSFHLRADYEFTVETRVTTSNATSLTLLRDSGVNRISFGVQSFDTAIRRACGRRAAMEQVLESISTAASIFPQVSIDLIYNLPGQTMTSWERDMEMLLASPATGASIYRLILIPDAPLGDDIAKGLKNLPGGIDSEYAFFVKAHDLISSDLRWRHMSSVHSGKAGIETNRYNATRASSADIAAVGAGAAGRIAGLAYRHGPDAALYTQQVKNGKAPHITAVREHPRANEARSFFSLPETLELRTRLSSEWFLAAGELVDRLCQLGAACMDNDRVILTREGRFWSYTIGAICTSALTECLEA